MNRARSSSFVFLVGLFAAAFWACDATDREPLGESAVGDSGRDARREGSTGGGDGATDPDGASEPDAAEDSGSEEDAGSDAGDFDAGNFDASVDAADANTPVAPTVNGIIASAEYGSHVDGENQQTNPIGAVWTMTWTDTHLYIGIANANVNEAAVLYIGVGSVAADAGSAADGTTDGYSYDSTRLVPLPFRAGFVAYFKSSYNETRAWNGSSAWGSPSTTQIAYAASGTVREVAIPWSAISSSGRPTTFSWLGYVTSNSGYAYGEMPPDNPSGNIGASAVFPYAYAVADSTPQSGTKPFSTRVP